MFEVHCEYPLDEEWEDRDKLIKETIEKRSSFSGAGCGIREHGWIVREFEDAIRLKEQLSFIPGAKTTIRER
jgi:L-lactate utilization protein LutC